LKPERKRAVKDGQMVKMDEGATSERACRCQEVMKRLLMYSGPASAVLEEAMHNTLLSGRHRDIAEWVHLHMVMRAASNSMKL
jgi:hypothetical protein